MIQHQGHLHWYRSEPRTPKEREVFTVMTVAADGAAIYLASVGDVLLLRDAAACAVLVELAMSARRRLLEIEEDELRGAHGAGPAAAAVGAAGEAGPGPHPTARDPVRVLPPPPAGGVLAGLADAGAGAGSERDRSEAAGGSRPAA